MSPSAYAQFRRWQRAMLSGSKPCPAGCGRTVSMNAKACLSCAEAIAKTAEKLPELAAA
jgi:hypothetical protein